MPNLGAIIMLGKGGTTPQEQLVYHAQQAATLDLILMLQTLNISPIICCAADLTWLPAELNVKQVPDPTEQLFHFGSYLAKTMIDNQLEHLLYFGGASAPLLNFKLFQQLLERLKDTIKN